MEPKAAPPLKPLALVGAAVGLFGVACGMTWLYLGMRSVMEIGGACAEGGPYQIAQPCPDGVPGLMVGGILGGLVFLGIFAASARALGAGYGMLTLWAWPALFLSLGWNFLEYGVDAPDQEGLVWGWLVCGVLFALMGGLPLLFLLAPKQLRAAFWPPDRPEPKPTPRPWQPRAMVSAVRRGPTPAPARDGDLVDSLERLAKLRASGALDEVEYERAKDAVLKGSG